MSVEIKLNRGRVAIVDDEDADLAALRWYVVRVRGRDKYAHRGTRKFQSLHATIGARMGIVADQIDHRDGDGFNCRRSNLRGATNSQNNANKGPQKNNSSGFKGVTRNGKKWEAKLYVNRTRRPVGRFDDPVEAAKAYDRAAVEAFGEFAWLNFPGGNP